VKGLPNAYTNRQDLFHHADIILSGDKDFIEADIERPLVFSPSMLYDYLISQQGL
jgi:hypothetical protein